MGHRERRGTAVPSMLRASGMTNRGTPRTARHCGPFDAQGKRDDELGIVRGVLEGLTPEGVSYNVGWRWRRRDWRAAWARWAAWAEAGGRPPMAEEIESAERALSWWSSLPWISSVNNEAQAMEAVQPRQRKRAAMIRVCSSWTESCRTSPQTGLVTSILAVGLGSSPTLRGDWKWSRRVGENMGRVSQRVGRGVEGEEGVYS